MIVFILNFDLKLQFAIRIIINLIKINHEKDTCVFFFLMSVVLRIPFEITKIITNFPDLITKKWSLI
ncbi:hypothetical protein BpHYR1_016480 [Brachionus plicatilis]|uniref:Uncharacterized protein n=1 Tax=Brachionus plicatilis TaxID=10195 RepID=A0A3M7RUC4_BRAPC|nr:hypothetical protein BpHYR1_016480 [Brachionus plicatilis]